MNEPAGKGAAPEALTRCSGACQFAIDMDMRDHSCTSGHCVYADYPEHFRALAARGLPPLGAPHAPP